MASRFLRILSDRAGAEDVRHFFDQTADLTDPGDLANIDAVLQVSIAANRAVYDALEKGDDNMSDVVREYFNRICKEDIKEAEKRGEKRGERRGEKQGFLKALTSLVHNGLLSVSNAAAEANMSEAAFMACMKKMYP